MANTEQVEKMQVVVDSLRANPDVVVAGGHESTYLSTGEWPSPYGYWSRTLDIFTHPKDPIYKTDELNEFMLSLVPELKPDCSDRFFCGSELNLGVLYYDDKNIGTAALSATVQLKEGLSVVHSGLLAPEWSSDRTLDLQQRTWVRVFPDAGHLADAAEGYNLYSIPMDELRKRGTGRVVASLLQTPMLSGVIEVSEPVELEA